MGFLNEMFRVNAVHVSTSSARTEKYYVISIPIPFTLSLSKPVLSPVEGGERAPLQKGALYTVHV